MPHEVAGVPNAYDRTPANPDWTDAVFREDYLAQAADHNDAFSIVRRRNRRISDLTAKDGDRVIGGEIVVEIGADGTGLARLRPGTVYIAGDVLPVSASILTGINFAGEVEIGVKLTTEIIDENDDHSLLGLAPGTEAETEPGSVRRRDLLTWALEADAQPGDFYPVYVVKNGAVLNQAPPPALSGIQQQIARYDFDANGNYVVDGCEVSAVGLFGGEHVFSISAGAANISGYKIIRETAMRHAEPEAADLDPIAAEPHTFTGATGGSTTITVSRAPIASVQACIVVKQVSETVVRGATPNGSDDLSYSSVVSVVSITQGGNTYVADIDFNLAADAISWLPGGDEPAMSSTYTVTYRYNEQVMPSAITADSVTVSGGVNGTTVLVSYTSKLPRIDLLCLDQTGRPVYVKGIAARAGGLPPLPPTQLLKLAEIHNDWISLPRVVNNGPSNVSYNELWRYLGLLLTMAEQFERANLNRSMLELEPVSKRGIFTDNFVDDFYRDPGEPQTAAINRGVLQLAIDPVLFQLAGNTSLTLDYSEFVAVRQDIHTSSMEINPYDNFTPMPAGMRLEPGVDFWTDEQTEWTSPVTREFTTAPDTPPGQETLNELTGLRRTVATTLRQIAVAVHLEGFASGENLATLTFDGVDIKPVGTQTANASGELTVNITIPAGIPSGSRLVRATGAADSFAEAIFVGEGTIDTSIMRRVTLVARAAPAPVINVINNITNITNVTQEVTIIQQQAVEKRGQNSAVFRGGGEGRGGLDPLAQSFTLPEPQHIVGLDFKFTHIGNRANGVRVQLATVQNGYPTNEVLAETFINMQTVLVGEWVSPRFDIPVFGPADREFCFVILTNDPDHAVAIAKLGDIDQATGKRLSAQAYTVGVLFTSANRLAWTAHQDMDLTMRVITARFDPVIKTVDLWSGALDAISDIQLRGSVDLPTDAARLRYELVRASGQVIRLAPGQNWEFSEYVSENVTVRAVLEGSRTISPTLWPGTMVLGGRIRTTGTYVSRLFEMGAGVDVKSLFAAKLPAGSSVAVECDAGDGSWQTLSADGAAVLGGGWTEPRWKRAAFSAAQGRIKVNINGGPASRLSLSMLRGYSI